LDSNNFGRLGGWKMGLIVSVATMATAFITEPVSTLLPEMPEVLKQALEQVTEGPLWVSLLSVSVFAPLFEEWLCRGLVLRGLLRKMNPFGAILISAAFFAVLHMNPWQAIPAFVLGVLFGYVYYKTGSLKLTMLMHCVNNTMAVVLSRIPSLSEAETLMEVMSPWAYAGVYAACVVFVAAALVVLKGIRK
jgi:membrane protease YdiL (CAAX protease family)